MFDADTQDYLATLGNRPPAQMPATLGDVWNANWGEAGQHTIGYLDQARDEAFGQLTSAYRNATGRSVDDDARAAGVTNFDMASRDEAAGTIRMLSAGLPDEAQKQLGPHLDLDAGARRIAAKIEHDAADIGARTYGVSGVATAFMAGLARTMVDPPTLLATGAIAALAPEAVGALPFAAREFAVNAGAAAVQHPFVSLGREGVGLQPTSFAGDVLSAGIGGAALGSTLRAGGWAARRLFAGRQESVGAFSGDGRGETAGPAPVSPSEPLPEGLALRNAPPEARDALGSIEPEDFDAVARHVERRGEIDAGAPDQSPAGREAHAAAIADASQAIDAGKGADALPPIIDMGQKQKIVVPRDVSLLPFLASEGGLKPNPELDAVFGGQNPFIPGFGRLIRQNGRSLDDALIAAREGRYLHDEGDHAAIPLQKDTNDLLDAIAREHGGEKIYTPDAGVEREIRANVKADKQARAKTERMAQRALSKDGIDPQRVDRGLMDATVRKLHYGEETDPLSAYEAAIMEAHDQYEARHAERIAETEIIPGWDVPHDPAAAPQRGGEIARLGRSEADQARGGERAAGGGDRAAAETGEIAGADVSSAGQLEIEPAKPLSDFPLTDAGGQAVIPGAEKAGQGELAQRGADRALQAKTAQRDTDALPLFNDQSKQSELFATDRSQSVARETADIAVANRADAERVLAELGDIDLHVTGDDGNPQIVKASELLAAADEDKAAAREFQACINGAEFSEAAE